MSEVTRILARAQAGDPRAVDELLPLVYGELRKLAAAKLAHEKSGQTLDSTALVHEVYLRLIGSRDGTSGKFVNHQHFFAAAAEAMRRILVERARSRRALKRGGDHHQVPLADYADSSVDERLLHLDEALSKLSTTDPLAAKVVEVHHFAGLSRHDSAVALGISEHELRKKWTFARAWLKAILSDS